MLSWKTGRVGLPFKAHWLSFQKLLFVNACFHFLFFSVSDLVCLFVTVFSILKSEVCQLKATSNGDHKSLELYLIEKTKALQSENAALKAANAELTGNLT